MSSCQPPTVNYTTQQFSTLRVLNFAGFCTVPMDIYWDPTGTATPDAQAKIYNLDFGGGSVYETGILVGQSGMSYHLVARRTRDLTVKLKERDFVLQPGKKYSWVITKSDESTYQDEVIEDRDPDKSTNAHIRFINEMPGTGSLAVHVNDPFGPTLLTPAAGIGFNQVGDYFDNPVVADVGISLYVVDVKTNGVVARLFNQTPVAGNCYTLVYSGDLCRTPAITPEDTVTDKQDTLRLRMFDDNNGGNDQTAAVTSSMRYNIINGIVDNPHPYGSYTPDTLTDNQLGFVFNGLTLPQHMNFSLAPIMPLTPGGASVSTEATMTTPENNPVYDVAFVNAELPNPLDIKAYATDGIPPSTTHPSATHLLFDVPKANALKGVGNNLLTDNNKSYTFFFADSVAPPGKAVKVWKGMVAQIPDVCPDTSIRLVFLPGIIRSTGSATSYYTAFYYQMQGRSLGAPPDNGLDPANPTGFDFGVYDASTVLNGFSPGQSVPITITATIGPKSNPIQVPAETFTAIAGGIYEIATVGTRANHKFVILRANPF